MGLPQNSGLDLHAKFPSGVRNLITDVPGVTVGHQTIEDDEKFIHTGVTAILPHQGDLFHEKVPAGTAIINGFGKSAGLVQVQELGTLETPIILTNTLSVGTGLTALVKYMLERNEDIGVRTGTVNGVVTECNDGSLSDIRGLHVKEEDVRYALDHTGEDFAEGAVGGGTGMCCLGLKGGIGSASRLIKAKRDGAEVTYTVGALVMSNFGAAGNLVIGGKHYDTRKANPRYQETLKQEAAKQAAEKQPVAEATTAGQPETGTDCQVEAGTVCQAEAGTVGSVGDRADDQATGKDKGSIIMVIATDAPLSDRQLKRVAFRATHALGRVGSYSGNGSGDVAIAFSTGVRFPHYSQDSVLTTQVYFDDAIDDLFEATVEAVEESIISSLWHARTTTGIRGRKKYGLQDYLREFED